jgi:hypothetical protein
MKKFTFNSFVFGFLLLLLLPGLTFGQKTVKKSVPGDYATIQDALLAEFAATNENLASGDSLVISVAEGVHYVCATCATNFNLTWPLGKDLNVLIKGAGADKTIQRGPSGRDARVADNIQGTRFLQLFAPDGGTGKLLGSFTFKDMTFQYLGSYRLAAAQGAVLYVNNGATRTDRINTKFENVVFDNNVGQSIYVSFQGFSDFAVENCLFKDNVVTLRLNDNAAPGSLISKPGGVFRIVNSTFISNEYNDVPAGSGKGAIIDLAPVELSPTAEVVLQNNAFVNSKNVTADFEQLAAPIRLAPLSGRSVDGYKLTMVNNIMIGNLRAGKALDTDILFNANTDSITWVAASGNIFNKVLKVTEGVYSNYSFAGSKIDPSYTYTDPRINFTMNGEIPALTNDSKGIGKVTYTGDGGSTTGIERERNSAFRAYPVHGMLIVEGLSNGSVVEIFSITGALVKTVKINNSREETSLPSGLYLVRSGRDIQKVIMQ